MNAQEIIDQYQVRQILRVLSSLRHGICNIEKEFKRGNFQSMDKMIMRIQSIMDQSFKEASNNNG